LLNNQLESQFKSWHSEHGGIPLKVARAYTATADDCQDLAQEILLQVWRSLPRFEGRATPATWSYRVALNTALGWRRKEQQRQSRQLPIGDVEDQSHACNDHTDQPTQRETVERLYAAIRQLPKADAALVLLYLDNLSYAEMADVLGITESNVGVKLNRAKKALRRLMEASDES
jgi:RNA polymerase sigma-70 factor (ECF subfamily)